MFQPHNVQNLKHVKPGNAATFWTSFLIMFVLAMLCWLMPPVACEPSFKYNSSFNHNKTVDIGQSWPQLYLKNRKCLTSGCLYLYVRVLPSLLPVIARNAGGCK